MIEATTTSTLTRAAEARIPADRLATKVTFTPFKDDSCNRFLRFIVF